MCTPQGVLFSRQAILENLLAQKKANKRKLAAWEAQQETLAREVGWLQLLSTSTSDQDVWQHSTGMLAAEACCTCPCWKFLSTVSGTVPQ